MSLFLLGLLAIPSKASLDSPLVDDFVDGFKAECTAQKCGAELEQCDGPGSDCAKRANCVKQEGAMQPCFNNVHWSDLDDTEVKVFDCAHKHGCMPHEYSPDGDASSFLQILESEKKRRGLNSVSFLKAH